LALFDWQRAAIAAWRGNGGRGVIEAVTGTGKTLVAIEILRHLLKLGQKALIVVPSIVLLDQWKDVVQQELGIDVISTLGGNRGQNVNSDCPVTIGVVNSVANIAAELEGRFDVLVADECHRYGAQTFKLALLQNARWRLGLTATFERSDGGVDAILNPYFGGTCYQYDYTQARQARVIAPYSVLSLGVRLKPENLEKYKAAGASMSHARQWLVKNCGYPEEPFGAFMERVEAAPWPSEESRYAGMFLQSIKIRREVLTECEEKLEVTALLAPAILKSSPAIVFCETIDGAEEIARRLRNHGVHAAAYHGSLTESVRSDILERLSGNSDTEDHLDCVVAVRALDEGIDVTNARLGIIFSGSRQRRQMVQRMGRVVRRKESGGAAFITVFAYDTAEDPSRQDAQSDGGDFLGELRKNAENADNAGNVPIKSPSDVSAKSLADLVYSWTYGWGEVDHKDSLVEVTPSASQGGPKRGALNWLRRLF
jgi:RNA polymerase primary sigma factor